MNSRIHRREFLRRSGIGTAAAALSVDGLRVTRGGSPPSLARRMNVVHVISDQHQAACTGYEGHPQAITPNMNRLAASGARFARAYTQNPICTPSRTSILSGQYCHNHGYYGLNGPVSALQPPQLLFPFSPPRISNGSFRQDSHPGRTAQLAARALRRAG